jgi:hypothetical protein
VSTAGVFLSSMPRHRASASGPAVRCRRPGRAGQTGPVVLPTGWVIRTSH